jgi:hypothetical protein
MCWECFYFSIAVALERRDGDGFLTAIKPSELPVAVENRSHQRNTLIHKSVAPAWIVHHLHAVRPCGASLLAVQIRSRRICAGIQAAWIARSLPSMALDIRFPAGMTTFMYNDMPLTGVLSFMRMGDSS